MEPFWEEIYKEDDILAFGDKPNESIVKIEPNLPKSAHIIDVGCGDGTNVLYLAKQGYLNVEGIDYSEAGIQKLTKIAKQQNLSLSVRQQDLCTFDFNKKYDLIMSFGTLHFVAKQDWHKFIKKAKEATVPGGYHIMQIFTNKVPASFDIAPYAIGLADEGELLAQYSDWEIIETNAYVFDDEHKNVPLHQHASNKIITRKPLSI